MNKQKVIGILEELHAVMMLEYHNMNWLALDNKRRNEEKRELIKRAIEEIYCNRPGESEL